MTQGESLLEFLYCQNEVGPGDLYHSRTQEKRNDTFKYNNLKSLREGIGWGRKLPAESSCPGLMASDRPPLGQA